MSSENRPVVAIPADEANAFARCFFPYISAFFESEDGKVEYAAYLAKNERTSELDS